MIILIEIRKSAFIKPWKEAHLQKSTVHAPAHEVKPNNIVGHKLMKTDPNQAAVDKTTKDQMSLEVIHKAEQIEKVAHDLKERMRG